MDSTFLGIVVAVLAALPGIMALIIGRKKASAETENLEGEAADKITQTALLLVTPLKDRITEQDAQLTLKNSIIAQITAEKENLANQLIRMREEKLETDAGIERLLWQFKSIQVEPVWKPKGNIN